METTEILGQINKSLDEFMQTFSSFDEQSINSIPFADSWTPAQVAQHVVMSDSGFTDLLNGPDTETKRKPDEHVANLKAAFLNFDIKMKSPEFILPPDIDYKKEELLATLAHIKGKLNRTLPELDMEKTCTGFELPVMGYLTRTEVVHFILYHTQRHVHQLKNIKQNQNKLKS